MNVLAIVRVVAVFSVGLVAGILVGDRMGASFARPALPHSSFVTFQQIQHAHFVKMMPILLGIAVLASLAWLVRIRSHVGSASFAFLALATITSISVAVLTRMVNVPINEQLMTWTASSPPPDVMEIWARWEQAHTVRTGLAAVGFFCAVLAFSTSRPVPAGHRDRPVSAA
jgi:Domain of unknown function (DUF1772)